jgi:N-acetylglucosaminyldiphosphoundecaprenol N-acetyl-beta-D-mannosaminyltransferase
MTPERTLAGQEAPQHGDVSHGRPSFAVLGVRVDAVQIDDVVRQAERWIAERSGSHWVAVTGMHGVTETLHDASFLEVLNSADLVVADGMPLVWLSRLRGRPLRRRVYGPELMLTFLERTAGYRHYFYGGAAGVAERLAGTLAARFPAMRVAGADCPPFHPLTPTEDDEAVERIHRAAPDVLWVGLSTPKQERWMHAHRGRLRVPVVLGVGAAFDIHAGTKPQAPVWLREHGLEWSYRLRQEPRRLWRRYLVYGAQFSACVLLEQLGLKKFGRQQVRSEPSAR